MDTHVSSALLKLLFKDPINTNNFLYSPTLKSVTFLQIPSKDKKVHV